MLLAELRNKDTCIWKIKNKSNWLHVKICRLKYFLILLETYRNSIYISDGLIQVFMIHPESLHRDPLQNIT